MRAAQKLLGVPIIDGGVPGQGLVVEGVKGVKYTPLPPGMYYNGRITALLAYKSHKMPFFSQKYLTRCTLDMFFEEYLILNLFAT